MFLANANAPKAIRDAITAWQPQDFQYVFPNDVAAQAQHLLFQHGQGADMRRGRLQLAIDGANLAVDADDGRMVSRKAVQ